MEGTKGEAVILGHAVAEHAMLSACNIPQSINNAVSSSPTETEAGCCMASGVASTSPAAPPGRSHYPCCESKAGPFSDRVENNTTSVTMAPDSFLRFPKLSEGGGLIEDREDHDIGAED